jgi:uncharacterized caspase-like protein
MLRWLILAIFSVLCLNVLGGPAMADKKVALVIGNSAYKNAPLLSNPRNDANDVAASLERSGFKTISGVDLDRSGMDEVIIRFAREVRDADVALFYYGGHALQFAGINYLIPIDAKVTDDADLRLMTRVDDIVAELKSAKALRILVLDSCRNNPFTEELKRSAGAQRAMSIQRGLAAIENSAGMIVSYATQAGRTASDGVGRNSPYTAAFLRHIEEPEEIGTIFRRIAADVYETSGRTQLPELSLSVIGELYLNGRLDIAVKPRLPASDPCTAAADHWRSAQALGTLAAFEDHVARFPTCSFAGLAQSRIAVLAASPNPSPTDTHRFDGIWKTSIVCDAVADVHSWSNNFLSRVKNSELHGETGVEGRPGWIRYDGKIESDGVIEIRAKGLTCDPKITLHHLANGTSYGWKAIGRFDEARGNATRVEGRLCRMDFVKQSR